MTESILYTHKLSNGLVLLADPMPGVQSAAFNLLIPAGAAYEPADRCGLASMLSEWITRGAGDRDSREILTDLDNLGVTHGEAASTVHTSVSGATLGRNLIPALAIFADIVLRPRFDDDEIEPIRALAAQSLQSLEDDPGSKVIYELRRRHYPDPWGRPAPGSLEGVEATTGEDMRRFFHERYRPDGAILGVAGAIDWPRLKDEVEAFFGDWKPGKGGAIVERPTGPKHDHITRETNQIQIALAYPTETMTSVDYYQARAAVGILGGFASARLFTEVREKRGLCYSVGSSYETHKNIAAVMCHAGTAADRAQQTLDVTLAEIDRLHREGVDSLELDMMRAGLKSSLIMQQESSMNRASAMTADWYFLERVRPLDEIAAKLDGLTAESINEYLSRRPPADPTILTLGPKPLAITKGA